MRFTFVAWPVFPLLGENAVHLLRGTESIWPCINQKHKATRSRISFDDRHVLSGSHSSRREKS